MSSAEGIAPLCGGPGADAIAARSIPRLPRWRSRSCRLLFPDAYWRTNLIVCALNVMLAIGLDFVLGYAGQLNLGQSAFYGSALMSRRC